MARIRTLRLTRSGPWDPGIWPVGILGRGTRIQTCGVRLVFFFSSSLLFFSALLLCSAFWPVEKKGDSHTDLRGQISVLLFFFSSSLLSAFWPMAGGLLETDLWGQISVLLFFFFFFSSLLFFSSSLLLCSAFWPVGVLGSGPWGSWGLARGGSRRELRECYVNAL